MNVDVVLRYKKSDQIENWSHDLIRLLLLNGHKMALAWVLCFIAFEASMYGVMSHPGRPPLVDPAQARGLFHLAEQNRTADGFLTKLEVADIFSAFDGNGDGSITESEFTAHWKEKNLGEVQAAIYLFHRADTDVNGVITQIPDMERVFSYFDLNDDNRVSEPEFVVTWASLTS